MSMHQLILFASGRGSNVQAIIDYFSANGKANVALIVCNNAKAGVLDIALKHNIPVVQIDRETFKGPEFIKNAAKLPAIPAGAGRVPLEGAGWCCKGFFR
jgi:folate-dependent phosphoribosylglycinamide formyltransferase PurN